MSLFQIFSMFCIPASALIVARMIAGVHRNLPRHLTLPAQSKEEVLF